MEFWSQYSDLLRAGGFLSEWRELPSAPCLAGGKKLDDSSRLDVAELARVHDMLPSLFPSWSG